MSVLDQPRSRAVSVAHESNANGDVPAFPTRIVLQPIAAPSVLGWFAFAGATFIVAAWMAGWYGSATTPDFLFPFAALFGGLAQFVAGMWSYRARDVLATAMHGTWAPSGWATASSGRCSPRARWSNLPDPSPGSATGSSRSR